MRREASEDSGVVAVHLSDEVLDQYLDRALGPDEGAAVAAHLAACAECRATLAMLGELYGTFAALPASPLPVDLAPRVLARIARGERLKRWRVVEVALAAQALLTLLIGGWFVTREVGRGALAWLWSQVPVLVSLDGWRGWRSPEVVPPFALPLALAPWEWAPMIVVGVIAWVAVNRAMLGAAGDLGWRREGA